MNSGKHVAGATQDIILGQMTILYSTPVSSALTTIVATTRVALGNVGLELNGKKEDTKEEGLLLELRYRVFSGEK